MKILFITALYPESSLQTRVERSYALHSYCAEWINYSDVLVIRPTVLTVRDLIFKRCKSEINVEIIDSVKVITVPVVFNYFRGGMHKKKICGLLRDLQIVPDIIVGNMPYSNYVSYLVSKVLQKPLVLGLHQSDFFHKRFGMESVNGGKMLSQAGGIVCHSPSVNRSLVEAYPITDTKQFVAISGVNRKYFLTKSDFELKRSSWNNRKVVHFSTAARLVKMKRVDTNLRVLRLLSDKGIDWEYSVIGSGEELSRLKRLAYELGIEEQVHFYGALSHEDTLAILAKTHVYIMISVETLGIAYLEAMATGNIVIGKAGSGIDGIITDRNNGFLCEGDEENHLLEKLLYLLTVCSVAERDKLLRNSFQTVMELDHEKSARAYHSFLEEVCCG